eukprot:1082527-Pleurochrysis_carterae.AAC.3
MVAARGVVLGHARDTCKAPSQRLVLDCLRVNGITRKMHSFVYRQMHDALPVVIPERTCVRIVKSFCTLEEAQKCQCAVIARGTDQAIFKFPEIVPARPATSRYRRHFCAFLRFFGHVEHGFKGLPRPLQILRQEDHRTFGGIYRPVYFCVLPCHWRPTCLSTECAKKRKISTCLFGNTRHGLGINQFIDVRQNSSQREL